MFWTNGEIMDQYESVRNLSEKNRYAERVVSMF